MTRFAQAAFAAVMLFATTASAGSPAEAQKFIDTVASDVLAVIKTKDSQSVKLGKLEGIFSSAVDIPYVGKYVLARHWNTATPAQAAGVPRGVRAVRDQELRQQADQIQRPELQAENARAINSDYAVTMEIVDEGNPSVFVDYTLREEGSSYKVIDIAVEGVSLRATQRSEFNSIVNSKGIDYLISALKKQAAKK